MTAPRLELPTVGRISVDLYAEHLKVGLHDVSSFRRSVGGTATNVAVAAARLGYHCAVLTRVGDDPMGGYIRHALEHTFDVDTSLVGTDPALPTPLAFATMEDPAEPELISYRSPKAPDMMIDSADIDRSVVESVPILWFPTSCLSAEPSRSTIHELSWRRPHLYAPDSAARALFIRLCDKPALRMRPKVLSTWAGLSGSALTCPIWSRSQSW